MSKELMKLALEALEMCEVPWTGTLNHNLTEAITALREELAKPDFWEGYVPEPVKPAPVQQTMYLESGGLGYGPAPERKLIIGYVNKSEQPVKPATEQSSAAQPAQQEPVAFDDADIYGFWARNKEAEQPAQQGHSCYCPNCEALSKELAELKEQKPIAWRVKWPAIGGGYKWMMVDSPLMEKEGFVNEALYASPQPAQQEPFGYFQYDIRLDAWVQNRVNNKGVAFYIKEQK